MAGAFDIKILWTGAKDVFIYLSGKADKRKEDTIEAHKAMNTAFIKTHDYLKTSNGNYVTNTALADVWNEASAAVMKVDLYLGEMLYNKSRFWLDPDLYLNLGREEEILELKEIVDEMERLRIKLK